MRKYLRTLAVAGAIVGLGVAACGSPPPENKNKDSASPSASAGTGDKNFKACMVSDSGGFDDKSFNQTSHKGMTDAASKLGIKTGQVESKSDNDYPTNVNSMVSQKCSVIVTVGFKLGDATYAAAKANPDIDFAIVDFGYDPAKNPPLKNLQSLVFNTAQSSFMAGYLAAGLSKSGTVGTFGGMRIPTVTIFMDGYAEGVAYYNAQKSKNIKLVGWDEAKQDGTLTEDFENKTKGQNAANNLLSQGADIIFPVAGPAGLGGLAAVKAKAGTSGIWVDTDGCTSASEYCSILASSVYKAMDLAVEKSITNAYNDKFDNTTYVGTLENDGTGLSQYHDFDSKIPAELKQEIDQIKQDIIGGKITIKSAVQPK